MSWGGESAPLALTTIPPRCGLFYVLEKLDRAAWAESIPREHWAAGADPSTTRTGAAMASVSSGRGKGYARPTEEQVASLKQQLRANGSGMTEKLVRELMSQEDV